MDTRRRRRLLAPILVLLVVWQSTAVLAIFANNFDAYPSGSRSCLYAAANASSCDGDTVTSMNACLCSNSGSFVISSAECIGQTDSADLETVYTTMASACSLTDTPLTVSQKDFLDAGTGTYSSTTSMSSSTATSSTATSTATRSMMTTTTTSSGHAATTTRPTSTPTNSTGSGSGSGGGGSGGGGLSSTTRTIIVAVASVAGVAVVAIFAYFLIRMWRNRQGSEEHQPMLGGGGMPGDHGAYGGGGSGLQSSPMSGTELSRFSRFSGVSHGANTPPAWKTDAVPERSDAKWAEDPYESSPSPALVYQQLPRVYELPVQGADRPVPVEMPATPMAHGASPVYHHPTGQPHSLDPNAYR